jgi:hypothetical protein
VAEGRSEGTSPEHLKHECLGNPGPLAKEQVASAGGRGQPARTAAGTASALLAVIPCSSRSAAASRRGNFWRRLRRSTMGGYVCRRAEEVRGIEVTPSYHRAEETAT